MTAHRELAYMRRQTLLSLITGDLPTARRKYRFWRALSRFNRLARSRSSKNPATPD
jgi:hypothetical protein